MTDPFDPLRRTLDDLAAAGKTARLWLRDDDAVAPTPALDRLLSLGADHGIPLTLAVIPQPSGPALADRLQGQSVEVAPHGWTHANHAPAGQKPCELAAGRPVPQVLEDLSAGLARLHALHGPRLVPVLVPPWNRIGPALIGHLPALGFRGLSLFGPVADPQPPLRVNVHVDLIDWRGTRSGRATEDLVAALGIRLQTAGETGGETGFMTHHLVHDRAAWSFVDRLFALTTAHPAVSWHRLSDLIAGHQTSDR